VSEPSPEKKEKLHESAWIGVRDAFSPAVRFVDVIGGHVILLMRALSWLPRRPVRFRNYVDAAEYIGFGSLPIVLLVGLFTGMVMSLQSVAAFRAFGLESLAGGITGKALALELGPVLTSLMVAGRAGSGIATELGTMRITKDLIELTDVLQGLIKAVVFGLVVILVGCYQGYHASGGGRGVGLGTTRAVVIASVCVLVMDYFLSDILLTVMGPPGT
jgi:phospholipid/cholesterol/gamma-HCH transport system permease protein